LAVAVPQDVKFKVEGKPASSRELEDHNVGSEGDGVVKDSTVNENVRIWREVENTRLPGAVDILIKRLRAAEEIQDRQSKSR
jgi:hypothetical protein